MHRRRYIATVAAAVTVGCVSEDGDNSNGNANGAGNGNGDTTENGEDGGETEERITVSDVEHRTETEALHYIAGTAHNQSDEDLQFQIRVDWFDENGTLLEETFSQIRADIAAGQSRKWDTTYYNSNDHGPPDDYEMEIHIY
jgi:hypothetical protein